MRSLQISSVEWGILLPGPRPHAGDAHNEGNCAVCVTMLQVLFKACPQCQNHLRLFSPSCRVHGTSQWDRWWSLWETCLLNHSWSRISGSIWMELYLRARFYLELSSRLDSTHKQGSLVNSLINWNTLLNPLSEIWCWQVLSTRMTEAPQPSARGKKEESVLPSDQAFKAASEELPIHEWVYLI